MTRVLHLLAGGVVISTALGACDPSTFTFPSRNAPVAAEGETVTIVARDVEAPEVFQEAANGLWDGRPTLGGVWVSHPRASQPERAIIRNPANGQFVVGTLFPGERIGPNAPFALSSEAARALGIPAGATLPVSVTALRPEKTSTVAAATETRPANPVPTAPQSTGPNPPAPLGLETEPATAEPAAPAPSPTVSSANLPAKPYVQIGIFSVEANARGTATALNSQGISTKVTKMEINGKPFWRVVAGPATSDAQKQSLLKKVKAQGFADAYFVTG